MSEHSAQDTTPNQREPEQQSSLDYFLEEAQILPSEEPLTEDQLRASIEAAIWLKLDHEEQDNDSTQNTKEKLEQAFKDQEKPLFTPQSRAETQIILTGPKNRLGRAAGKVREGNINIKAAKPTFLKMKAYSAEARAQMRLINEVMIAAPSGEDVVDPGAVRQNRQVQDLLANRLMRRQFLADDKWPASNTTKYKNTEKYYLGAMEAASKWASDEFLTEITGVERTDIRHQMGYWSESVNTVAKTPGGRIVRSVLGQPETPKVIEVTQEPEEPIVLPVTDSTESAFKMPPEIERLTRAKHESASVRMEHQIDQSASPFAAGKKEAGGGQPIKDDEGKMIGTELPDDQPSAETLVKWEVDRKERQRRWRSKRR